MSHLWNDSNPTYRIWTQSVTQHKRQHDATRDATASALPSAEAANTCQVYRTEVGKSWLSDFLHLSTVLRCSKNSKDLLLLLALAAAAKRGSLGPAKPSSFAASQFSTLFGGKNSATSGDANCGMTLEWYWLGIWNRGILNPMVVFLLGVVASSCT